MASFPFRSLVLFALLPLMAGRAAVAAETISLTVDATRTQRKILHAHLVMPVKPGPLTLYYPEMDSRRARSRRANRESERAEV